MREQNKGRNGGTGSPVRARDINSNFSPDPYNDAELLRVVAENASGYAFFAVGDDGRITGWNASAERLFGYPAAEIVGQPLTELAAEGDRAAGFPRSAPDRTEDAPDAEGWMRRADGSRFWGAGSLVARGGEEAPDEFVCLVRDLTERHRKEEAVSTYKLRFRDLTRQSPFSTVVFNPRGNVIFINRAFEKMWGLRLEDLTEYNVFEDEQAEALGLKPHLERLFAGETVAMPPVRYDPSQTETIGSGKVRWMRCFCYPVKDEDGRVREFVAVHEDVTARIEAEQLLSDSEERLGLAQKAGRAGTFEWLIKEDVNIWSPELETLYGVEPGTFGGTFEAWRERVVAEDAEAVIEAVREALEDGAGDLEYEFRAILPDGGLRWLAGRARFVYDEAGEPERMIGINFDITDRKRTEEELRRSREQYEALVLASSQIVWTADPSGAVHEDSPGWRQFTGQTYEQWRGYGWLDALHPDDREQAGAVWKEAVETGGLYETEYRIRHRSGEYRWALARGVPLKNPDGSIREWIGMNTDIHEQKQAEAHLLDSEERFRTLADNISQLAWMTEPDGWIFWYNRRWYEYTGTTLEEMQGWGWQKVHHPDHVERVTEKFRSAVAAGEAWEDTFPLRGSDGRYRWFLSRAMPIRDEEGRIIRWFGTNTDITEQKETEESLRTSEEFTRSVIASSPDCFKILDIDGQLDFMNENGQCLMEIDDFGRVQGAEWTTFWEGANNAAAVEAVEKARRGEVGKFQGFCLTAKGTPKWWDVVVAPVRDAHGEVVKLISISRDITANKQAEAEREELVARELNALRQSELERQKLESLFKQAPAIINIFRAEEHVFELVHPRMKDLLGDRNFSGRPIREVLPEAQFEHFVELLDTVYRTGEPYFGNEEQAILTTPEGSREAFFDFIYQPWYEIGGDIGGVMSFAVEVTDRVEARREMERTAAEREEMLAREQQLRQTAEEASRLKDEFLAMLSHELRTPLSAIMGWSQMMRNGILKPDQYEKAIETIERNARSQGQLIEDLLDITRIITGKLRLNIDDVDLGSVVKAALQTVGPAAQAKKIDIHFEAGPAPAVLLGDAERLQQVVWNLLSNAVKFTPKNGDVYIELESLGSHLKLTVRDTGEGIEAEFLPYVFDRFSQADMSSTRRKGGLGLGLSIVRHLIEMHGGTISVFSEGKGRGAVFTVILPVSVVSEDLPAEGPRAERFPDTGGTAPTTRIEGLRILVVDDEPDTCEILKILLEQCGAHVETAGSAARALKLIEEEPPDVLISDIAMPGEDGYSLLRKIRALPPEKGGAVPAIALTAYARQIDRKKALEAGFQSHIAKPVDQNSLVAVLAGLV